MTSPAQPLFTMNKLVAEKVVGRGDLFKVRIDSLVIVEDFNESRKYNDPQELRAHIDGMYGWALALFVVGTAISAYFCLKYNAPSA